MEFLGWLFGKPSNRTTPEAAQASHEAVQASLPFNRPDVDINAVTISIQRYNTEPKESSRIWSEERAKEWINATVEEGLKKLLELFDPQHPSSGKFKYVRQGDKIVLGPDGPSHVTYAVLSGLIPEEAGYIKVNPDNPDIILIYGDSIGLGIKEGNKKRPDTISLFRRLAPNFKIEEELPKPPTPRPRPTAKP